MDVARHEIHDKANQLLEQLRSLANNLPPSASADSFAGVIGLCSSITSAATVPITSAPMATELPDIFQDLADNATDDPYMAIDAAPVLEAQQIFQQAKARKLLEVKEESSKESVQVADSLSSTPATTAAPLPGYETVGAATQPTAPHPPGPSATSSHALPSSASSLPHGKTGSGNASPLAPPLPSPQPPLGAPDIPTTSYPIPTSAPSIITPNLADSKVTVGAAQQPGACAQSETPMIEANSPATAHLTLPHGESGIEHITIPSTSNDTQPHIDGTAIYYQWAAVTQLDASLSEAMQVYHHNPFAQHANAIRILDSSADQLATRLRSIPPLVFTCPMLTQQKKILQDWIQRLQAQVAQQAEDIKAKFSPPPDPSFTASTERTSLMCQCCCLDPAVYNCAICSSDLCSSCKDAPCPVGPQHHHQPQPLRNYHGSQADVVNISAYQEKMNLHDTSPKLTLDELHTQFVVTVVEPMLIRLCPNDYEQLLQVLVGLPLIELQGITRSDDTLSLKAEAIRGTLSLFKAHHPK